MYQNSPRKSHTDAEQSKEFGFAKLTADELAFKKSNIVSVYQAGAFFGSFFAYISAYYLGRRKSLWVFAIIFEIGNMSRSWEAYLVN